MILQRLTLLFRKPRLLLGDTLYRLFLRAPVALALLPVLGEQRLALLREALFHPFLCLLPQVLM
jgi:hypothetical protein